MQICCLGCEVILKTRTHNHIRSESEAADMKHAHTKFMLQSKAHMCEIKTGLKAWTKSALHKMVQC